MIIDEGREVKRNQTERGIEYTQGLSALPIMIQNKEIVWGGGEIGMGGIVNPPPPPPLLQGQRRRPRIPKLTHVTKISYFWVETGDARIY